MSPARSRSERRVSSSMANLRSSFTPRPQSSPTSGCSSPRCSPGRSRSQALAALRTAGTVTPRNSRSLFRYVLSPAARLAVPSGARVVRIASACWAGCISVKM